MFAARQRFVLLLIAGLCLDAYGTPVKEQQEKPDSGNRNGVISWRRQWPDATIHYKIDDGFSTEQTTYIKLAMRRMGYVSCIRFEPATPENLDYVLVTVSAEHCRSRVGFQGGEQKIELKPDDLETGCFRMGSIEHELLHTLGFYHQESSSDRDDYVKIIENNIIPGKERYFKKYDANRLDDFGAKYDYGSVMHSEANFFTNSGEATIVALKPLGHLQMGQRYGMSTADIERLNNMYKCPLQQQQIQQPENYHSECPTDIPCGEYN